MTTPVVTVVGSSNTDMIVRTDRIPRPGETVLGEDLVTAAGGKGANQAVAAAKVGGSVRFVARIGDDAFGRTSLDGFRRVGLDTRFVTVDSTRPSGVALIIVKAGGGENIIAVSPGANAQLTPADIQHAAPAFEQTSVVLVQLETPIDTVLATARAGQHAGALVILNPAPAPMQPLPDEIYPNIHLITPNETEAEKLTGISDPHRAADALLAKGVNTVIVTLGKAGALLAEKNRDHRVVPGFFVKAVDTTAAGDAFNGGLAVALARGDTMDQAIRFAHAVAALSVTRFGAQPSLATADEVAQFLAENP